MKNLMNKAGYISIETVIVAGLMLTLGLFIVNALTSAAGDLANQAITAVRDVTLPVMVDPTL